MIDKKLKKSIFESFQNELSKVGINKENDFDLIKNSKRKEFKENDKIRRLLWCDRHCCLCEKQCDVNIEFAHIEGNDNNDIDNAIPVCYDCHAKMGMYNPKHPKGNRFKVKEIKQRREQIYEKYTRQYIAPIDYVIPHLIPNSSGRDYPNVTFNITNLSDYLPVKLWINLSGKLNNRSINLQITEGLYTGKRIWNLNPRRQVNGHFKIRNSTLQNLKKKDKLEIRVNMKLIDVTEREHTFLEDGFVYNLEGEPPYWYFEP